MSNKVKIEFEKEELYQLQLCVTCRLGVISAMFACATSDEEQNRLANEQTILSSEALKLSKALNEEDNEN